MGTFSIFVINKVRYQ
ncbi:erythromycin resistance leader peptide, partial [Staphylococcus aureus]|nr:erythromycin resistance leader peptide [Enterococcus faecium]